MALFFQLLSESELKELSTEELGTIKAAFYHALYNDPTVKRELGAKVSEAIQNIRAQKQTSDPDKSGGS